MITLFARWLNSVLTVHLVNQHSTSKWDFGILRDGRRVCTRDNLLVVCLVFFLVNRSFVPNDVHVRI